MSRYPWVTTRDARGNVVVPVEDAEAEVERLKAESGGWQRAAESQNHQWAKMCEQATELRAEVERLGAAHVESQRAGAEEAIARRKAEAEVERLKKERAEDEAFESESEKLWGECEEDLDAARTEVERLKAALREVLFHAANPPLHPYEVSRRWAALQRAREALGEVE